MIAVLLLVAGAWALAGWGVALLTVGLDPRLAEHPGDALLLGAYGLVAGALLGLVVGLVARLAGRGVEALPGVPRPAGRAIELGAAVVPLVYFALLPDTGLFGRLLTDLLFDGGIARRLFMAGLFVAFCVAIGALLGRLAERVAPERSRSPRTLVLAWLVAAVALGLLLWPWNTGSVASSAPATDIDAAVTLPTPGDPDPAPVLLLCSDGVDPRVVRELVDAGELPTFARLEREAAHGPLATLEPTLSPIVWTTIATGRPPVEHGILHFLYFRLPGLDVPIRQWPLHTGLNFQVFPRLEQIFGPGLRRPYTSAMRRSDALWDLVGRFHRVGVYRWLLSWPAEPVNGFFVAGGIGWVDLGAKAGPGRAEARESIGGPSVHPAGLFDQLRVPRIPPPTPAEITAIAGSGIEIGPRDRRLRAWRGALQETSARELPALVERFDPAFVAASFQPVDAVHHLYGQRRGRDVPFGGAVDAFYRLLDERLGELLANLDPETRVILVSDHGFDFEHGHHTHGPPGVFYAIGPGFAPGEVEGLSIYDVAPLVLRLLDLPLPEDLPGTRAGGYQRVLDPEWAAENPERRVATYGERHAVDTTPVEDDAEVRDLLRSLGYVE